MSAIRVLSVTTNGQNSPDYLVGENEERWQLYAVVLWIRMAMIVRVKTKNVALNGN